MEVPFLGVLDSCLSGTDAGRGEAAAVSRSFGRRRFQDAHR